MTDSEQQRIAEVYAGVRRQQRAALYAWHRPEVQWAIYRMRAALARQLAGSRWSDLSAADICDIGCGHGSWIRFLLDSGASAERLHGIDLIPERVACARAGLPVAASITEGNATALPYPDARFDLVSANTVFSSILDPAIRQAVAREMWRVLRPGGLIYILDFRYSDPRNPDTNAITTAEIRRLFPSGRLVSRTILLLPPIARRLAPWCLPAVGLLDWLFPFLRGHAATAIWKATGARGRAELPVMIRLITSEDFAAVSAQVAEIHRTAYHEDHFSSCLSNAKLEEFYGDLVRCGEVSLIAQDDAGKVVGFAVSGEHVGNGVRDFTRRNKAYLTKLVLRSPKLFAIKSVQIIRGVFRRRDFPKTRYRLLSIAVSSDHQSSGIGRQLLAFLENTLRTKGITSYGLSVRNSNARAIAFYHRHRFNVEGTGLGSTYFTKTLDESDGRAGFDVGQTTNVAQKATGGPPALPGARNGSGRTGDR